jgi:hypothetical protein
MVSVCVAYFSISVERYQEAEHDVCA